MGSRGAYTSRIFGQQYSAGALRGAIESKVSKVSAKSHAGFDIALKHKAREDRHRERGRARGGALHAATRPRHGAAGDGAAGGAHMLRRVAVLHFAGLVLRPDGAVRQYRRLQVVLCYVRGSGCGHRSREPSH